MVIRNSVCIIYTLGILLILGFCGCAGPEVEEEPDEPKGKTGSLIKMGDVYFREGKYRNAMRHYLEADEQSPRDAELKFRIALLYADYYKKYDDAIQYYQEATQIDQDYSEAYNNLGTIYARQEKWTLAIEMYQKALDNLFYSTPEKAYYNMASAYLGNGQIDKAVDNYKMAIELKPQYVAPYLQLGLIYQRQGQHGQAIESFREARMVLEESQPREDKVPKEEWNTYRSTLASTYYYQALSLTQLQEFSDAREAYQKALEVAPSEAMRERVEDQLNSLPQ